MRVQDLHWSALDALIAAGEDRCVLPLGCTEQHAFLSLATDSILAERVAVEAAEPLNIPVFPVLAYGITPLFAGYPGSPSLRVGTYLAIIRDLLDALRAQGFARILIVNGHGGNAPAQGLITEWMADHPDAQVQFHNWWNAPRTWAAVQAIDPVASHASWMENFPWTRLPGVSMPETRKPMTDLSRLRVMDPAEARRTLGDGNFGGLYQRPDGDMLKIWSVAVEEARALLNGGWRTHGASAPARAPF